MKKILFLTTLCFSLTSSKSQTLIIYKTYYDFLNKTGEKHEKLNYSHVNSGPNYRTLVFKGINGNLKLNYIDNWGFLYKEQLYRFDNRRDPVWVGIVGKNIVYYENGYAHLSETGYCPVGWFYYLSTNLNSDPFVIPTRRKVYKRVMDGNPDCKPLFECIENTKNNNYKKCVEDFENIKCGTQFQNSEK